MNQDLTAPTDRVRVSRNETFRRAYECLQDETTPMDLGAYTFQTRLYNKSGLYLAEFHEAPNVVRDGANIVIVCLPVAQMAALAVGEYTLRLFGIRAGIQEEFVEIVLTIER